MEKEYFSVGWGDRTPVSALFLGHFQKNRQKNRYFSSRRPSPFLIVIYTSDTYIYSYIKNISGGLDTWQNFTEEIHISDLTFFLDPNKT